LPDLVRDKMSGKPPKGDWVQLVGAAYDREIVAFTVKTTEGQDDELIRELNSRKNTTRFNLFSGGASILRATSVRRITVRQERLWLPWDWR
jgi:hypothetical protein